MVVLPKDGTSRAFSKAEYRLSKGELIQRREDKIITGSFMKSCFAVNNHNKHSEWWLESKLDHFY